MPPSVRNTTKAVHYPTMMFTGVAGSIAVLVAFKMWVKPHLLRQQRLAGEQCADTLIGPLDAASAKDVDMAKNV